MTIDGGQFWERPLEGESHTAFMAFCLYRDLGLTRSLKKAAELFYADGGPGYQEATEGLPEDRGGGAPLTRFKRWSSEHSWVARAEAFDASEAQRRSLEMTQKRIEMVEDHLQLVALGKNLLARSLYDAARGETYFPPGVIPALMREVTTLHRLTLGEATQRLETVGDPDRPPLDYSQLTDDELDTLDALRRKLLGAEGG